MVRLPGRLISNTGYESCDSVSSVRRYGIWNMNRGSLLGVLRDMRHDSGKVAVASPIPTQYRPVSLSEAKSLWKSENTAKCEVIGSAERSLPATMLCSCTTLMHETTYGSTRGRSWCH